MYYGNIKYNDIANGEGVRVSLFVSGCSNNCEGCFQPQTWNPHYGKEFTDEDLQSIMLAMANTWCAGLTILGGDPFYVDNIVPVSRMIGKIRENSQLADKNIWVYTGYTYEELINFEHDARAVQFILHNIDVLVDGRFVLKKLSRTLPFRGSSNQRLIDMRATLANDEQAVVLYNLK